MSVLFGQIWWSQGIRVGRLEDMGLVWHYTDVPMVMTGVVRNMMILGFILVILGRLSFAERVAGKS